MAFVGCGYVFDIYMRTRWAHEELEITGVYDINSARAKVVADHYGLHRYGALEELLSDQRVEMVVNLTNIGSHYEVSRQALLSGKHVYSEKPLTTDMGELEELFSIAASHGVVLTGAPCNLFSDAVFTIWKALRDGAIGKPVLIYAELDDDPAHLMDMESVQSPTGANFPFVEEFQEGCTFEHIAYHLVWICAIFGPALSVTGFSDALIEKKTETPLSPADTPDFSVACLHFGGGVVARITCSIVAPRDHRMRIIGEEGEICADNCWHDQSPVWIERFSTVSLSARKSFTVRRHPLLASVFGVGGKRIRLIRRWKSHAIEAERGSQRSVKQRFVSWLRRREVYAQDKFLGIAEMARAIVSGRPQPLPPDFLLHINELTLLVQRAGRMGHTSKPTTTFSKMESPLELNDHEINYLNVYRETAAERLLGRLAKTLHTR